jgi:ADP-ribose pyrophosphatase YjhB (NUDIX family)
MSKDHLDFVREFMRAFNAGNAARLGRCFSENAVTDGVFLMSDRGQPVAGREPNATALRDFFAKYGPGLEGSTYVKIRTLARLETGRGWVHAEWVGGVRERETGAVHHVTGYTHFFIGPGGTIDQQRSVVQPAGADASADIPPPPGGNVRGSRRYPSRPIVGVGAVVFVGDRVVLIKRRFEPLAGQWSLPGGTLEVGETLEAGTAREILEETGLVVDVGPVVEVFDRILLDEDRKVLYHFVLIDYLCRPVGGQLQHGSDVADVTLAHTDSLDSYGLTPKTVSIIQRAVQLLHQ